MARKLRARDMVEASWRGDMYVFSVVTFIYLSRCSSALHSFFLEQVPLLFSLTRNTLVSLRDSFICSLIVTVPRSANAWLLASL